MGKRSIGRVAAVFAVLVAMMIALPGAAYAKTVTGYRVKASTKVSTLQKKAPAIGIGKNTVKLKKSNNYFSWVKFTARTAGKYKFTFSAVKGSGTEKHLRGSFNRFSSLETITFVTKEGKRKSIQVWDAATVKKYGGAQYKTVSGDSYNYRSKRTCTVKLKKGETIFLNAQTCTYNSAGESKNTAGSFKVSIKRG